MIRNHMRNNGTEGRRRHRCGGFTLIEMIVVILIILILGAVSVPKVFRYIRTSKQDKLKAECEICVVTARTVAMKNLLAGRWEAPSPDEVRSEAGVSGMVSRIGLGSSGYEIDHMTYESEGMKVVYCGCCDTCSLHSEKFNFGEGAEDYGTDMPEPAPEETEEPETPPGGSEEPTTPPGGTEEPETPPGGTEEPTTPPGGTEEPTTPPGGGEEPELPEEDEGEDNNSVRGPVSVIVKDDSRISYTIIGKPLEVWEEETHTTAGVNNDGIIPRGTALTDGKDIYIQYDWNETFAYPPGSTLTEMLVENAHRFIRITPDTRVFTTKDNQIEYYGAKKLNDSPKKGDLYYEDGKFYVAMSEGMNEWQVFGDSNWMPVIQ